MKEKTKNTIWIIIGFFLVVGNVELTYDSQITTFIANLLIFSLGLTLILTSMEIKK